ncbi:hypothetical protein [Isoptericola sp. b408]|uniref:hypothetical protein n=1 Tax=Isoptericola sp. b408 TaxID=3064653 RepID=UPI002712C789|nr:hypothetical protein [Isoptericola sp. b408]MDO8150964.1 hypothetical protein [Isoptericola sp. b408]
MARRWAVCGAVHRSITTTTVAGLLLPTGACGALTGVRVEEAGGHVALVQLVRQGGMDAAWAGVLALDDDGCWGLASEADSDDVRVVVWPAGFSVADDGRLVADDGTAWTSGDAVVGAGGEHDDLRGAVGDVADACVEAGEPGLELWRAELG